VAFVAATVQGAIGFGFTLIAVSFFLWIVQSGDAIQMLIVINLVIAIALVGPVWRTVNWALLVRLVIGALFGFPLGLMAFQRAEVDQLKLLAAGAILTFVAFTVFRRGKVEAFPDAELRFRTPSALGIGVLAGSMTIALGMPGPPLVLYLTTLGAGKQATRSIAFTFFVVSYTVALILQATAVGVSRSVWLATAFLVPVAVVGSWLGHILARHVSEAAFRTVVLTLVGATGASVILEVFLS